MKHGSHGMKCNCSEDGTCSCGAGCTCSSEHCSCSETGECTCGAGCDCAGPSGHGDMKHGETCTSCGSYHDAHKMSDHAMKAYSGTIQSEDYSNLEQEQYQLTVLLPPSSDIHAGVVTYSASTDVQVVVLHGPLTKGEVKGQNIWTPDDKTNYASTVNPANKMGSWMFAGNALAVKASGSDPFDITYSIVTMGGGQSMPVHEKRSHGVTCDCAEECSCDQDGSCICSGEVGPCMCGPNCNCGE